MLFLFVSCKTTPEIKPSSCSLLCMFHTPRWVISIYSMIDVTGNFHFTICKLIGQFLNGNWLPLLLMVQNALWNFYQRFSRLKQLVPFLQHWRHRQNRENTAVQIVEYIQFHLFVILFFELYSGSHNVIRRVYLGPCKMLARIIEHLWSRHSF